MYWISHRGNFAVDGITDPYAENNPAYIDLLLKQGFNVEIDVIKVDTKYAWLGHDKPQFQVKLDYILQPGLWVHCKNIQVLYRLRNIIGKPEMFCIDKDSFTVTSSGFIWAGPDKSNYPKDNIDYSDTICVMPEDPKWGNLTAKQLKKFGGICTDNLQYYQNLCK